MTTLTGKRVFDPDGTEIGTVTDVMYDDVAQEPLIVTVDPGLFRRERLLPALTLTERNDDLVTTARKDDVMAAPKATNHVEPRGEEQMQLFAHYGLTAPVSH